MTKFSAERRPGGEEYVGRELLNRLSKKHGGTEVVKKEWRL
jgi:hypothetical protein